MNKLNKLTNKEIKSILRKIQERYETDKLENDYIFFSNKEGKVYIINKEVSKVKNRLASHGMYFCKYEKDGIRLSIEGSMLIKKPKQNVIKLNEKQFQDWMEGMDIDIEDKQGYFLLEYNGMIMGCTKGNKKNLRNFVPKHRRTR